MSIRMFVDRIIRKFHPDPLAVLLGTEMEVPLAEPGDAHMSIDKRQ
jgi:hypothetical protein